MFCCRVPPSKTMVRQPHNRPGTDYDKALCNLPWQFTHTPSEVSVLCWSLALDPQYKTEAKCIELSIRWLFFFFFLVFFFFHLFLSVGGYLLHNIAVGFAIRWHESAMELHVFPIPIPPPTSLSTRFLWVFPVHQARALVSCIPPGLVICFTTSHLGWWSVSL